MYGGSSVFIDNVGNNNSSRGVGGDDEWEERTELVLVLSFDSYLFSDSILVNASKFFSCPTWHHLLTTYLLLY